MRTDLRVKHDIDARKKAAELFWKGRGFESVAKELSIPRSAVRKWQQIWKAFGSGALLPMDGKQARHTCSQKAAAAKAVVGDGMSKSDAMARYGIMSLAPLERWCRACREGGAEAQAQGTADGVRGRGKAAHARAAARAQGAAARGRGGVPRKTAVPGRKGKDLARAKAEAVHALAQEGCRPGGLLAAAALARSTCRYALSHPAKPARLLQEARGGGNRAGHVQEGQLPRQCLHRGPVRPYEGRALPRAWLGHVRDVQGRPRGIYDLLEHPQAPEGARRPDPGGVPEPGRLGSVSIRASRIWDAVHMRLPCFSEWRHPALCDSLAAWLDMAICARYHEACKRAFRMGDAAWQQAV